MTPYFNVHLTSDELPSFQADTKHLSELNAIATRLPLYRGTYNGHSISVLIDSGASCNYVAPHLVRHTPLRNIYSVAARHVETAGGETTRITQRLEMDISLGDYLGHVSAYVFPSKFDLILGRTWLKQCKPTPNWFDDSWSLPLVSGGSTVIFPCNSIKLQRVVAGDVNTLSTEPASPLINSCNDGLSSGSSGNGDGAVSALGNGDGTFGSLGDGIGTSDPSGGMV